MPTPKPQLPLLLLLLLLSACASPSTPSATVLVTRQIQLPPLPASAKQINSPGYSQTLTDWRERAAQQLTTPSSAD